MTHLTKAHEQLFQRRKDEQFGSLEALWDHCNQMKDESQTQWCAPDSIEFQAHNGFLTLETGSEVYIPTEWSFSQLCRLSGVHKETVNRLSPPTAVKVFEDTLPRNGKPFQLYTLGKGLRSVHGVSYTRLYNADVMDLVFEFAPRFQAPQEADGGGTGLYCGEQDMFCFLIDPNGWVEIEDQAFAPGLFLWNSEVGRRSVGVQTFWFQSVCANHIVWDAVDVVEFSRKHTANVHGALDHIRRILDDLAKQCDARRDAFARVVRKAMTERLGKADEDALKLLQDRGINRQLAKETLQEAKAKGGFTIYAVVDALTRMSQRMPNAGDRTEADVKASQLLALAA